MPLGSDWPTLRLALVGAILKSDNNTLILSDNDTRLGPPIPSLGGSYLSRDRKGAVGPDSKTKKDPPSSALFRKIIYRTTNTDSPKTDGHWRFPVSLVFYGWPRPAMRGSSATKFRLPR